MVFEQIDNKFRLLKLEVVFKLSVLNQRGLSKKTKILIVGGGGGCDSMIQGHHIISKVMTVGQEVSSSIQSSGGSLLLLYLITKYVTGHIALYLST